MKTYTLTCCFCLMALILSAQSRQVAITIDDIPNVSLYQKDEHQSVMLDYLEEYKIPAAIFVNESRLFQNEHHQQNFDVYLKWLNSPKLTIGNHTYEHLNYTDTTLSAFQVDIIKGEAISKAILAKQERKLKYFRFPFNSLGGDSLKHDQILDFLAVQGYTLAPHTISSEDWMYNALYEHYLAAEQSDRADSVGLAYVAQTLKLFEHYEQFTQERYDRPVKQIYLCHENALNRDYLPILLDSLQKQDYLLISLDEALSDPAYSAEDYYYGRWGFSWFYRWIADTEKRKKLLRAEPFDQHIYRQYQTLSK